MKLYDVIKYEGDNDTIIWKYPIEDFNLGSQLIVHESQEAIFFMDGQALDSFGSGKYTLETDNLPVITKLMNLSTDGVSQFHSEVYFINKVEHLAIRWGTDTKIQYMEPTYNFPIYIGANGEMSIDIDNAKKLLIKLIGTEYGISKDRLVSYFKSFLMIRLKPYLSKFIKENKINIFEIDENLEEMSNGVKEKLIPDFNEYGINLKQFFITTIVKPDGDEQYEKFKELHFRQYADVAEAELNQKVGVINQETEKKKIIITSEGLAQKRKNEGYTYQEEKSFDVAKSMAENEGSGNFTSAGIGMGIMAGVGSTVGATFANNLNSTVNNTIKYCEKCGYKVESNQKFCENCGNKLGFNDKCINCGYQFTNSGKYCPNCGSERK